METVIVSEEVEEPNLPTYYSVLPAQVRYSKVLTSFEKILYSELSCLTTVKGYCYATNSYFAKIYDCSTKTISRSFSNLEKNGFIKIQLLKKTSGEIVQRRIFSLASSPFDVKPMDKSGSENIIKNNNINNIILSKNSIFDEKYLLTARSADDLTEFQVEQEDDLNLNNQDIEFKQKDNDFYNELDNLNFDKNFKNKEKKVLNLEELNYLKTKVNEQDKDIFDKFLTRQNDNTFLVDESFRGIFLDTVGIDYIIFLDYLNNKSKLKSNFSNEDENDLENATKSTRSTLFENISDKTTKMSNQVKNSKKQSKSKNQKEISNLQKIKNHYLENRRKMYEQGKCSSPIDSTNSVVINQRLNDLINKGVTLEQFYKVLDFAMADKFCNDIDYRFLPLIKENVFFKLYNDKNCHCVEPVEKKPDTSFKNIQMSFPKCKKCGFDLDAFGKCPFCDYDD